MNNYVRDHSSVIKTLSVDNDIVSCTEDVIIHVPMRYIERSLASVGTETTTLGLIPIIHKETGKYSVMSVNSIISLTPFTSDTINIDETEYYEFFFEANSPIMDINVVRRDNIMYNIIDEFLLKAKIPWYVSYDDLAKFLDTAGTHAGSRIGENLEIIEMLVSIIGRYKHDLKKQIRYSKELDTIEENVGYVPLSSVMYSVSGTANKLIGAYMEDGIISSLVTPSTKSTKIEDLLRD